MVPKGNAQPWEEAAATCQAAGGALVTHDTQAKADDANDIRWDTVEHSDAH